MKKSIPSLITSLNLACGFVAIVICDPFYSPLLIVLGTVFDIADGMVARALNAKSDFGKELDSLADVVTFGVAPAYLYYHFLMPQNYFALTIAMLLPVFSAIRLAIFNNDKSQGTTFKGLPTPANAMFFLAFPLIHAKVTENFATQLMFNEYLIYIFPVVFSLLLVSPIRMFSFKNLGKGFSNNPIPFIFLGLCILTAIFTGWMVFPISICLYIILSIIGGIFNI